MHDAHIKKRKNLLTPCRLPLGEWKICYANTCYLNRCCPVFRGRYPSPVRDYIPKPPVFTSVGAYDALPISYKIPVGLSDSQ